MTPEYEAGVRVLAASIAASEGRSWGRTPNGTPWETMNAPGVLAFEALPILLAALDEARRERDALEATMQGCSARARAAAIEECARVCDEEAVEAGRGRPNTVGCARILASRIRALGGEQREEAEEATHRIGDVWEGPTGVRWRVERIVGGDLRLDREDGRESAIGTIKAFAFSCSLGGWRRVSRGGEP